MSRNFALSTVVVKRAGSQAAKARLIKTGLFPPVRFSHQDTYFPDLHIQLNYILKPLTFHYGLKWQWYTTAELKLSVFKDGILIVGDYNDFLNEARLSAIAICLYLSSLLVNPAGLDLKLLYLDDVFIGLDAGNRIPILNILRQEFPTYQKFVSTYDRHWFELAKKQFESNNENSWSTLEIYVGTEDVNASAISKPIIIRGETNWEKAVKFLHHRSAPDYPASANYFRKAIEELLQIFIPPYELTDLEFNQYPGYKLGTVLNRTKRFLDKTNNDISETTRIIGLLHNLLHPLSHHEISSPIYKSELMIIEATYERLKNQLTSLDIPNRYKCILEPGKIIKISFNDAVANYQSYYEICLNETLILINDGAGNLELSNCKCNTDYCFGNNNGTHIPRRSIPKNAASFNYTSFQNAIAQIHAFLVANTGNAFPAPPDYLSQIEYRDVNGNWQPLSTLVIW